jgi:hypothetical protein
MAEQVGDVIFDSITEHGYLAVLERLFYKLDIFGVEFNELNAKITLDLIVSNELGSFKRDFVYFDDLLNCYLENGYDYCVDGIGSNNIFGLNICNDLSHIYREFLLSKHIDFVSGYCKKIKCDNVYQMVFKAINTIIVISEDYFFSLLCSLNPGNKLMANWTYYEFSRVTSHLGLNTFFYNTNENKIHNQFIVKSTLSPDSIVLFPEKCQFINLQEDRDIYKGNFNLFRFPVRGDGYCGVYALYALIKQFDFPENSKVDLKDVLKTIEKYDNVNSWFHLHALCEAASDYHLNLKIISTSGQLLACNFNDIWDFTGYIVHIHDLHYEPMISKQISFAYTLPNPPRRQEPTQDWPVDYGDVKTFFWNTRGGPHSLFFALSAASSGIKTTSTDWSPQSLINDCITIGSPTTFCDYDVCDYLCTLRGVGYKILDKNNNFAVIKERVIKGDLIYVAYDHFLWWYTTVDKLDDSPDYDLIPNWKDSVRKDGTFAINYEIAMIDKRWTLNQSNLTKKYKFVDAIKKIILINKCIKQFKKGIVLNKFRRFVWKAVNFIKKTQHNDEIFESQVKYDNEFFLSRIMGENFFIGSRTYVEGNKFEFNRTPFGKSTFYIIKPTNNKVYDRVVSTYRMIKLLILKNGPRALLTNDISDTHQIHYESNSWDMNKSSYSEVKIKYRSGFTNHNINQLNNPSPVFEGIYAGRDVVYYLLNTYCDNYNIDELNNIFYKLFGRISFLPAEAINIVLFICGLKTYILMVNMQLRCFIDRPSYKNIYTLEGLNYYFNEPDFRFENKLTPVFLKTDYSIQINDIVPIRFYSQIPSLKWNLVYTGNLLPNLQGKYIFKKPVKKLDLSRYSNLNTIIGNSLKVFDGGPVTSLPINGLAHTIARISRFKTVRVPKSIYSLVHIYVFILYDFDVKISKDDAIKHFVNKEITTAFLAELLLKQNIKLQLVDFERKMVHHALESPDAYITYDGKYYDVKPLRSLRDMASFEVFCRQFNYQTDRAYNILGSWADESNEEILPPVFMNPMQPPPPPGPAPMFNLKSKEEKKKYDDRVKAESAAGKIFDKIPKTKESNKTDQSVVDLSKRPEFYDEMIKLGIDPDAKYPKQAKTEAEDDQQQEEVEDPAAEKGDSDESEDEDVESDIFDITDDNVHDCCLFPVSVKLNNIKLFSSYRNQFKGKNPSMGCLFKGVELGICILKLLHQSVNIPIDVGYTIKCILKHRHDTFAYFFLNNIIGINVPYGTDTKFPDDVGSNRTPDFIQINQQKIIIYEFSVVGNLLRGNFLKGSTEANSKYQREINILTNQGYEVKYIPILFSTTSSIEENNQYWKILGYEIGEMELNTLETYKSKLKNEYDYLFSYSFDKRYLTPDSSETQEVISDNITGWKFKIVTGNKYKFYDLWAKFQKYQFEEGYGYLIQGSKGSITIRQRVIGPSTFDYHQAIKLRNNEYDLFTFAKKLLQGKMKFPLVSKSKDVEEIIELPVHGSELKITEEDKTYKLIKNIEYEDEIKHEDYCEVIKKLWKLPRSNLTTEFDIEKVSKAVEKFKLSQILYKTEQLNIKPVRINNPRRSFVNMFDFMQSHELKYHEGINIKIDTSNFSNSTKILLNRSSEIRYTSNDLDTVSDPTELYKYKDCLTQIKIFLKNRDIDSNKSFKRIKSSLNDVDRTFFTNLQKNLKIETQSLQNKRIANKNGLLKIDNETRKLINAEMNWSSASGYKLYMGEFCDLNELYNLFCSSTKKINFNINVPKQQDIPFFLNLKIEARASLNKFFTELSTTRIFNFAVFHSRLCYTLFSASNRNFNNDYILLDNLGLSGVALFVKGGRKITTTRRSKIFKLIYPCVDDAMKWQTNTSYTGKGLYEETKWMTLHQQEILDGIALPYKMLMNYNFLREKYTQSESLEIAFIPFALGLHNRRKTEKNLHNMRYLMVNVISDFSQVELMIKEFAAPSYSAFDDAIYVGLSKWYLNYVKSINTWKTSGSNDINGFRTTLVHHPYMKRNLVSIDDLCYIIYSTYLMTKGAYQQSVEQTVNLQGIMETHDHFYEMTNKFGDKFELNESGDFSDLYDHDFKYSKVASYAVGKLLAAELVTKYAVANLNIKYQNIVSDSVDSMANNRGLRYKGKAFFSHKGYFVVYKHLFEYNLDEILSILNSDETLAKKHAIIKKLNQTFRTQQGDNPLNKVIFHVVDKVQRGGGREIYVMDYFTKIYQYPLEKMFKLLCEYIDNELITIPAGKRASLIHKKNFEYKNDKYTTYFLTYDCRKWAPRCMPEKWLHMLKGMKSVLPNDFINDCEEYFKQHKKKEIKTRIQIYNQLQSKTGNKYDHYFTIDEEEESAGFIMPYSFIMGMFNMLSSLYHAGAVKLIKREIEMQAAFDLEKVDFNMLAHSDDSGGNLSILGDEKKSKPLSIKYISFFEHYQKCCNHLMSVKKCNASQQYFELVSILYLNDELLPLLAKFMGNVSLTFSGQGISSDMKQVISKSIELQSNGCSNTVCYQSQIILASMYRNFYRITHDTTIPALGGTPDSWPNLYMAFGSAIDEIRVSYTNADFYSRYLPFAIDNLDFELTDGTVNLKYAKVLRVPVAYKDFKKQITLPVFKDNEWFFSQNKTRHAMLNLFWFRAQLDAPTFATAVLNINEIRRAYDTLYMIKHKNIIGKYKNYDLNEIHGLIVSYQPRKTGYYNFFKEIYRPALEMYEDLSQVENVEIKASPVYGWKPTTLSLMNFIDLPIKKYNSLSLATQICRPELTPYLYTNMVYGPELDSMVSFLKSHDIPADIKFVKTFLDFLNKYSAFTSSFYLDTPNKERAFVGTTGLLDLIIKNHGHGKKLNISTNVLRMKKTTYKDLNEELIDRVNLAYLQALYKASKNESLSEIPVKVGQSSTFLRSVNLLPNYGIPPAALPFLDLIGKFEKSRLNLNNLDHWSLWYERQAKVGDSWVGTGILILKTPKQLLRLEVRNERVIKVKVNSLQEESFDDTTINYIMTVLRTNNLNINELVNPTTTDLFLAWDNDNILGLHEPARAKVGVPVYEDVWFDTEIFNEVTHFYEYGSHIVTISGLNYKLMTLNSLIVRDNPGKMFRLIDWETIDISDQTSLITTAFSDSWNLTTGVEYEPDDLKNKILKTEIYALIYDAVILKKLPLDKVFWDDIITHTTASEDILPIMFENTGITSLQKLLPQSKKDLLNLYAFYECENEMLFDFKQKWINFDNPSSQNEYLTRILMELDKSAGLATLPEIGDESEFTVYSYNNCKTELSHQYWVSAILIVCEALYNGFSELPKAIKQRILNASQNQLNENWLSNCFLKNLNNRTIVSGYCALTHNSMIIHNLLDEIYDHKTAFVYFARSFRKTTLQKIPRHPRYKNEWQVLIANLFKYCSTHQLTSEEESELPAHVSRYKINNERRSWPLQDAEDHIVMYSPQITTVYKLIEPEEVRVLDLLVAGLNKFHFDSSQFNTDKLLTDDFIDDLEDDDISFDQIRNQERKEGRMIKYATPVSYKSHLFYLAPWYINMPNCFRTVINKEIYYTYNINEDVAKSLNLTRYDGKYEKRCLSKYLPYYKDTEEISWVKPDKKEFKVKDISTNIVLMNETYNLTDPESYDDTLLTYLIKDFDITNDGCVNDLRAAIFSKKSPIIKAMMVRQIIRNYETTKTGLMEGALAEALKQFEISLKTDDLVDNLKIDFATTGRHKEKLLSQSTSYKQEFKQLRTLIGETTADLVTGEIIVKEGIKRHLIKNIELLIQQTKQRKKKENTGLLRILKAAVESVKIGMTNNAGLQFDEKIRSYITDLTEPLSDEEDISEIDLPEQGVKDFRFIFR